MQRWEYSELTWDLVGFGNRADENVPFHNATRYVFTVRLTHYNNPHQPKTLRTQKCSSTIEDVIASIQMMKDAEIEQVAKLGCEGWEMVAVREKAVSWLNTRVDAAALGDYHLKRLIYHFKRPLIES
jgi:hypothetical protein